MVLLGRWCSSGGFIACLALCNCSASALIVLVEFLLQFLQLWLAQQRLKSFAGSCRTEKPCRRVVETVLDGWQKYFDQSGTGDGLDLNGLLLQLDVGIAVLRRSRNEWPN